MRSEQDKNEEIEQECVCTPVDKKKKKPKRERRFETCPWDPRFPQQNQTNYCYISFIDWHRCIRLLGDDYPGCDLFLVCWRSMCPNSWKDKWFDQMNKGTFARPIYPPRDPPFEPPPYKDDDE